MNNTSYKDPAGFVFEFEGQIYRQINLCAAEDYDFLTESGLYKKLTQKGLLVEHQEVSLSKKTACEFYKIIKPAQIKYITYPYEWSFSALKDAALLTLKIQKTALKYKMSLKDASAYNIQFCKGKPVFIDTLSFEKYKPDTPWAAYGQFCRHFLAPLALMSYTDIDLNKLLITNIDGIALETAKKLLPFRAIFNFGILTHIIIHSMSQKAYENTEKPAFKTARMSLFEQQALIDSLINTVKSLKFPKIYTQWGDYYKDTNYSEESFQEKKDIILHFINKVEPKSLCDLGSNRGDFSRIASDRNIETLAFDIDPVAVEDSYLYMKSHKETNILPLLQDLTNPSPAIGFMNEERKNFSSRFQCDMVMALALIHHLAISNNLPFDNIAKFFSSLGKYLVIEFVPKTDSKVQHLLSSREDIFDNYDKETFESIFDKYFEILETINIKNSKRILYLMRSR